MARSARSRGRELADMRSTWDAIAGLDASRYVGDPARAEQELDSLFGRLGSRASGGTCLEVGCGHGRMTPLLARRFDRVIAADVSEAMLESTRRTVAAAGVDRVTVVPISGDDLGAIDTASVDTVVCYLVLQHLPSRELQQAYLQEFARVLRAGGEAYVQVPVLEGARGRAWRWIRGVVLALAGPFLRAPSARKAFRGFRPTRRELRSAIEDSGLELAAVDDAPGSHYRFSRDLFLRLRRRAPS